MRILIADNDERFLTIAQARLKRYGHEAKTTSTSGSACILVIREFLPEVLVLPRDVPECGSGDIIARMNEDAVLAKIPAILVSDTDGRHEANHCYSVIYLYFDASRKAFRLTDLQFCIDDARFAGQLAPNAIVGPEQHMRRREHRVFQHAGNKWHRLPASRLPVAGWKPIASKRTNHNFLGEAQCELAPCLPRSF